MTEIKLNYLLIVHKNLAQVDVMIEALSGKHAQFFIHIDRRISMKEIKSSKFYVREDVKIVRRRLKVNWGGFSMILATIALMKLAFQHNTRAYFILLSGQDLPIKSYTNIHNLLSKDYGKEYVEYASFPKKEWYDGGFDRINYYWFVDKIGLDESNLIFYSQKMGGYARTYFDDFHAYGGSQWWCLTAECVEYILRFIYTNPIVLEYFEHTLIPDEMFFHTIVLNSHFKDNTVNDNMRYIHFEEHASHPVTFCDSSYELLKNSNNLWARKFDVLVYPEVFGRIAKLVREGNFSNIQA